MPDSTTIQRPNGKPWLVVLNVMVGLGLACQLLMPFQRRDSGTLVEYGTMGGPQRTLQTLRWLDSDVLLAPCVGSDGSVFVVTDYNVNDPERTTGTPTLFALEGRTGDIRWKKTMENSVFDLQYTVDFLQIRTGPLWFHTGHLVGQGADRWRWWAFDPVTGAERRSRNLLRPGIAVPGASDTVGTSLPAHVGFDAINGLRRAKTAILSEDNQTVFLHGENSKLDAVDSKTGRKRWTVKTLSSTDPACAGIVGSHGGRLIVFGEDSGKSEGGSVLRAYDEKTGRILWQTREALTFRGGRRPSPKPVLASDGTIYALVQQEVTALDSATGKVIWKATPPTDYEVSTECAVGPDGTVYFGANRFRSGGEDTAGIFAVRRLW